MAIKFNKLESWLNVPAKLTSTMWFPKGEIQYGVKEFNVRGFDRIIQTKKRGIPLQWLIEESHKHYSGYYSSFMDNEAQKNRKYNNLPKDSIIPSFWFVTSSSKGYLQSKLLTAHVNKKGNSIRGIARDIYGSLIFYRITKQ